MKEHTIVNTGITCETFYNRLCRCSEYKEKQGYIKPVSLFFEHLLSKNLGDKSFLEIFSDEISKKTFTGNRAILVNDIEDVRAFYITCAKNIDNIVKKFHILKFEDKYMYKYKIKGSTSAVIKASGKNINLQFSYKNAIDTQKMLDFFDLNNYFYNESKQLKNDLIVMSVPTNVFFSIKYEASNYTMKRGFLTVIKNSKLKKCGDYCITCINNCKPTLINGFKRMEMII